MASRTTTTTFNPQDPKFKLFGEIPVDQATICVFVISFFMELLYAKPLEFLGCVLPWNLLVVLVAIYVFIFGSGIYGVAVEEPLWLIPYFTAFLLDNLLDVAFVFYYLVEKNYAFGWLLLDIADLAVKIWFIIIVITWCQYLDEKKKSQAALPMAFSNNPSVVKK